MKKKSLPVFFVGLLMCGCQMKEVINEYNVVPLPVTMSEQQGRFYLNSDVPIVVNASQEVKHIASGLSTTLLDIAGLKLKPTDELHENVPSIVFDSIPGMEKEAYKLSVTPQLIKITASAPNGFYYGLQTLYQLLPVDVYCKERARNAEWSVPCVEIEDAPTFRYRGAMLDVCRHFASIDYIKKFIDVLAAHKMNTFHWHLVDDPGWRLEIKGYPKLTEVGSLSDFSHWFPGAEEWKKIYPERERSYYTQDEIREIVEYAAERGIRILPEIEVPAHCTAATKAYPELLTPVDNGNENLPALYNVISPEYEKFIHDVLDQVIKLFDAKVIHIGGDEANYSRWDNNAKIKAFMKEHGLHTYPDMQLYAINEISKYLDKKGVKMIGWNEITGDNIRNEAGRGENSAIQLKPGTLVQFWDGSTEFAKKAIAKGYEVVNSNRLFTYIDYSYESIPLTRAYSFNPYFDGLTDEQKTKVLGCGCQMWGEATPTDKRIYFQTFPRLAAYAEAGWTPNDLKNYADFVRRITPIEQTWKQKGYFVGQPSFTMGKTEEPK